MNVLLKFFKNNQRSESDCINLQKKRDFTPPCSFPIWLSVVNYNEIRNKVDKMEYNKYNYMCSHCNELYLEIVELEQHFETKHKVFFCTKCGQQYKTRIELKIHKEGYEIVFKQIKANQDNPESSAMSQPSAPRDYLQEPRKVCNLMLNHRDHCYSIPCITAIDILHQILLFPTVTSTTCTSGS